MVWYGVLPVENQEGVSSLYVSMQSISSVRCRQNAMQIYLLSGWEVSLFWSSGTLKVIVLSMLWCCLLIYCFYSVFTYLSTYMLHVAPLCQDECLL